MIFVALGANLPSQHGQPEETLQAALDIMGKYGLKLQAVSSIWLTAPVPVSDQPWYRNAVAQIETAQSAPELLKSLQDIENHFGRVRQVRNEPRVLDLDLLAYHGELIGEPDLLVPHPRMHERAFVLLPLQELAPDWKHPLLKLDIATMLKLVPPEQMARKSGSFKT